MSATITAPVSVAVAPGEFGEPPNAVQCPVCWAIVLAARLDAHRQAAH